MSTGVKEEGRTATESLTSFRVTWPARNNIGTTRLTWRGYPSFWCVFFGVFGQLASNLQESEKRQSKSDHLYEPPLFMLLWRLPDWSCDLLILLTCLPSQTNRPEDVEDVTNSQISESSEFRVVSCGGIVFLENEISQKKVSFHLFFGNCAVIWLDECVFNQTQFQKGKQLRPEPVYTTTVGH